jgi:hypothetical protein
MRDEPPILQVHWERVLQDLLNRTEKFPKNVRFTFTIRVENLALEILEALVLARWDPVERKEHLHRVDRKLAVLRVLVRLCHARRFLDNAGFEHLCRELDEAGRMVGGWQASVKAPS